MVNKMQLRSDDAIVAVSGFGFYPDTQWGEQ